MFLPCTAYNVICFLVFVLVFCFIKQASSSFFIARFSVWVVGTAARNYAATPHGLPSPPLFRLDVITSASIKDPLCNWSI